MRKAAVGVMVLFAHLAKSHVLEIFGLGQRKEKSDREGTDISRWWPLSGGKKGAYNCPPPHLNNSYPEQFPPRRIPNFMVRKVFSGVISRWELIVWELSLLGFVRGEIV